MAKEDFEELCGFDPAGKTRAELEAAVQACGRVSSLVAAKKYAVLAALDALADDGVSAADTNRVRTRESVQSSRRAAATAEQLTQMPGLRLALTEGAISPEHADAAAEAAAEVSPEAADDALTRLATRLPADRFAKEAREWAGRNQTEESAATRQERARAERQGRVWRKRNGRVGIYGELDPVAGKPALDTYEEEMNRLYREDGGRDADPSTVRTCDQRGADALAHLLGRAAPSVTSSTVEDAADSARRTARSTRPKRPHPRYVTHLRIDAERCTGEDPSGNAAFLDGTPLPQAALEQIACESSFVGSIYAADGSILWQGRATRLATDDQWNTLIDRDGGCRHCGAEPPRCQAHHCTPWTPPARGPTDIENLVLVCDHAHHLIHHNGYRVQVDEQGAYHIVPPT